MEVVLTARKLIKGRNEMYKNFTIEEAKSIGKVFKAICDSSHGYEGQLTIGKVYDITVTPRILPVSPLCQFTNDRGNLSECHLERFTKIEEVEHAVEGP